MRGARDRLLADLQRVRRDEARMPAQQREPLHAAQPALEVAARVHRHRVRARHHLGQVDADLAREHHAVVRAAPGQMRHLGTGHQRLGRHATGVDAGAAEQVALDQRHALARRGQASGQRRTGLAGTDDDRVVSARSWQQRHRPRCRRRWPPHPRSAPPAGRCPGALPASARAAAATQRAKHRAEGAEPAGPAHSGAAGKPHGRAAESADHDARAELQRHLAARGGRQLVGDQLTQRQPARGSRA